MNKTIYITYWTLSEGIIEAEVDPSQIRFGKHSNHRDLTVTKNGRQYCLTGGDFHFTRREAVENARKRVAKEIRSLRKRLEKLERMQF